MKEEKGIIVSSSYKTECKTFNQWSGEIVIIGSIFYNDKEYRDAEILHLTIERDEDEVLVRDVLFPLVPYLKPIRSFRSFLHPILSKLARHDAWVIRSGAAKYLHELDGFSEAKYLLKQARSCMDRIKSETKGAERIARKILEIVEAVPQTDMQFEYAYSCEDAKADIDFFFSLPWQNRRGNQELEKALVHMTAGTTVERHNVSCQKCWDYYEAMKTEHCGG